MGFRESVSQNLPVPNPDSDWEMMIATTILTNVVRTGNGGVFVGGLAILVAYGVGLFLYRTSLYLFDVYSERLRETGSHVKVLRYALYSALTLGAVGLASVFAGEVLLGFAILSNTFCLFCVFTTAYDWWLDRPKVKELPSLKGLTAEEVIKMHKTVRNANG